MINPSRVRRAGVSLVGFLVAVAALSFVLIPFYLAFQTTRTGTVQSLNSLVAANVASAVIERYRAKTFSELEGLMLRVDPEKFEYSTRYINGPFQTTPPSVTVREPEVHRSGLTVFNADVTLAYFPLPNPDPDSPSFRELRQRMQITVRVNWRDHVGKSIFRSHDFTLRTMVHNEQFSAKPSLRKLTEGGSSP